MSEYTKIYNGISIELLSRAKRGHLGTSRLLRLYKSKYKKQAVTFTSSKVTFYTFFYNFTLDFYVFWLAN